MSILFPIICFVVGMGVDRFYRVRERLFAQALLYIAVPIVIFYSVYTIELIQFVAYSLFAFILSLLMTALAPVAGSAINKQYGSSVVGCLYGYFNIGWFGIPIAGVAYGMEGARIMAALYFGGLVFGNTVGYYLLAKGKLGATKAIIKIIQMPALLMFILGIALRAFSIELPMFIMDNIAVGAKIAVTILGMGLAGVGLSRAFNCKHSWGGVLELVSKRFALLLIVNTMLMAIVSFLPDELSLDWKKLTLFYILPIAANAVIFAAELGQDIQKISAVVGASTIFSIALVFPYMWLVNAFLR